ncbi:MULTISPECIES: energy-coupling factor ABC transporter ATP-binding protein [Anoxynatronum]|uniref:Cobalt/nickel transport system ATP-binding protein n=2 Tax=Anoxynatronum TaxID=210622 RepID=A0AA46AII1_9CLOT|nr:ATP-binding cassette domain-containing protein [Anoxynatronum buryatiense]SMP51110.1 cobalt/nickel transport system ATP-binding protein [Anoxynatronum buryatiense]
MMVHIQNLFYTYGDGTTGLKQIHLQIAPGRRTALLGVNGSGKTTLLYHLNGTFLPQQGQVTVLGIPVTRQTLPQLRRQVGFLFDYPDHQLFATTVARDVAFGPRNLGFSKTATAQSVTRSLDQVGLAALGEKPPYQLSLGQKKRAAIAGLLATDPQLIVCDEPFSGLDPHAQEQFRQVLDEWIAQGRSLIFSTHDLELAYAWADEVILLREGEVLAQGPPLEVLTDAPLLTAAKLPMPLLARLFAGHPRQPRNVEEALALIKD